MLAQGGSMAAVLQKERRNPYHDNDTRGITMTTGNQLLPSTGDPAACGGAAGVCDILSRAATAANHEHHVRQLREASVARELLETLDESGQHRFRSRLRRILDGRGSVRSPTCRSVSRAWPD